MKEAHKLLLTALIADGLHVEQALRHFAEHFSATEADWLQSTKYDYDADNFTSLGIFSLSEAGCWVMGWLYRSDHAAGVERCRECGEVYDMGGDGFDGLCPSCADKAEEDDDG